MSHFLIQSYITLIADIYDQCRTVTKKTIVKVTEIYIAYKNDSVYNIHILKKAAASSHL